MRIKSVSFISFLESRINYLNDCRRYGTASNYRRALSSLHKFLDGKELLFSDITSSFVEEYQDWLLKRGMVRNSVSFHMRILRAVFNKGVRLGYANKTFPFEYTYTGIDKTTQRYVSDKVIKLLAKLDLGGEPLLDMTRDIFLFGLYARGMAFVDIAHLRQENILGQEIVYCRQKTGQCLRVRIEPPMLEIIHKYSNDTGYVFPLLSETVGASPEVIHRMYCQALSLYNYRLKRLAKLLGKGISLSSYTARHTWANLAAKLEVPLTVISEGMGHTSVRTTQIYLARMEPAIIDQANRKILDSITLR